MEQLPTVTSDDVLLLMFPPFCGRFCGNAAGFVAAGGSPASTMVSRVVAGDNLFIPLVIGGRGRLAARIGVGVGRNTVGEREAARLFA